MASGRGRLGRWVPAALLALAFIPVVIGSIRVVQLLGGPAAIEPDSRFDAAPAAVVVRVVASIPFVVLGAFQFSARTRRRHPTWHRRAGRALALLGLVVAASALWLTLLYDRTEGTGTLLYGVRLLVGAGTGACLLLGLAAIRRRDVSAHRAWMTRAFALSLGAGTQAFTVGFGEAAFGAGVVRTDLMMSAAWGVNLAVAELCVRRPARPRLPSQRRPEATRPPSEAHDDHDKPGRTSGQRERAARSADGRVGRTMRALVQHVRARARIETGTAYLH